ncbi:MAG: hypothetical protein LBN21_01440 [Treponema sp.]|jgi:hypothetical protein|nr:hypothetical protein [Treponema sp.]
MKLIAILLSALMLMLAACSSTPGNAGSNSDAKPAASGKAQPGQIPVEVKESVLFSDGALDGYTTSEWDASYETLKSQTRYSASGAMVEKVEFSYEEDKGLLGTKLVRDVEDRLKNRVVYQYNGQGQLWKETLVNKSGKPVSVYEYLYDAKGNRTSRTVSNGTGIKLAETLYTYNNKGLVVSSETRDGAGRKISSTTSEFDSQGNLVSQKVHNGAGEVATTINAVWENGREIKNEQIGADGKVQIRVTNEFGANGELTRKTVENFQGQSVQIVAYEYTFKPDKR